MLAGPPGVAEAIDLVHGGDGRVLVRPGVRRGGGVEGRILRYCEQVWGVRPVVKPDYYKESSRTRSRSFPHLTFPSQSDESVGLGI